MATCGKQRSSDEQLAEDLWKAVKANDANRVSSLLEQGADPNHQLFWSQEWKRNNFDPPLHTACRYNVLIMAKLLVRKGRADVDRGDGRYSRTALHWACFRGNMEVIAFLVNEGKCKVDVRDKYNCTPLHSASKGGNKGVIQYLVEELKWDVDVRDQHNWTPLHCACFSGNKDLVQYFVEELKCDIDVRDGEGKSTLDLALASLNVLGKKDCIDVALYLINCGCGGDESKAKLLCRACYWGYLDVVKKLIEQHKVDPKDVRDEDNKTPLHWSCKGGYKGVVKYLVEEINCDVNVKDWDNEAPLHLACAAGNKQIVEYLVEKASCNINIRDKDNKTPLHHACTTGSMDVVEYLIEKNCDINVRDKDNMTLLHCACRKGKKDIVEFLVEKANCDVNVRDKENQTPLHYACARGFHGVVKYLVEKANCDITVTDYHGRTPLDLATQSDWMGSIIVTNYLKCLTGAATDPSRVTGSLSGQKRPLDNGTRPTFSKKSRTQRDSQSTRSRLCPNCTTLCIIHHKRCPQCDHEFPISSKSKAKRRPRAHQEPSQPTTDATEEGVKCTPISDRD